MEFKSFTELAKKMAGDKSLLQNFDFNGLFNGDITGKPAELLQQFYHQWGNYLDPVSAVMSVVYIVLGWIAKALFVIANSLENVFNSLFKLFGLFGYLGNDQTLIGKLYLGMQVVGVSLFVLLLTVRVIFGLLGKNIKYKDTINNVLLVTVVVSVLPLLINVTGKQAQEYSLTKMVQSEAKTVRGMEGGAGKDTVQTLAIQPFVNNVVDLKYLALNNFDTSKFKLDKAGYLKPDSGKASYLSTDPASINYPTRLKFGSTLGVTNPKIAENWEKKNHDLKGLKGLFEHKINDDDSGIDSMSEHRFFKGMNALEAVYLRYKVNWWALYAQLVTVIILLGLMSIKFVKSLFELVITGIIAPVQGYSSVDSSKKFKELLTTMIGTLAGMFFEVVILRVTLEIMRDAPAMIAGNLTGFEQTIGSIIIYLGTFFGAMQGVTIIERWLGVSTSQGASTQQLMGAMMAANTLGGAAKSAGQTAWGATKLAGAVATGLPGVARSVGSNVGQGLAKTAGAAGGLANNIGQQGVANTAKGAIFNATDALGNKLDKATNKVKGGLNEAYQQGKEAYQQGKETAETTTKNPYPTAEDQLAGKVISDEKQPIHQPDEELRAHNEQAITDNFQQEQAEVEREQQLAEAPQEQELGLSESPSQAASGLEDTETVGGLDTTENNAEAGGLAEEATGLGTAENKAEMDQQSDLADEQDGMGLTTSEKTMPYKQRTGPNTAHYGTNQGLTEPNQSASGLMGANVEEANTEENNELQALQASVSGEDSGGVATTDETSFDGLDVNSEASPVIAKTSEMASLGVSGETIQGQAPIQAQAPTQATQGVQQQTITGGQVVSESTVGTNYHPTEAYSPEVGSYTPTPSLQTTATTAEPAITEARTVVSAPQTQTTISSEPSSSYQSPYRQVIDPQASSEITQTVPEKENGISPYRKVITPDTNLNNNHNHKS
ncbi:MAG: hypothetical protein MR028_06190 [Ligilactobacillus agilis]|uniref:pLS20_p028 family conjugation system transmembrane protein n=1 Tax=Ligilactobacillus agilis TaxID=1601 RepID=UPI00242DAAEA|nr:hypothetical protein [Ligilactobacillus agilis]MCI5762001.1 hypothetical protein [Ligilactobacillus agilis]